MNPQVDKYLIDGCMRCKYGATPQCKVNNWKEELIALRQIAQESGLTEELKWGVPVYTLKGKNVITVSALKNYCSIGFFKGVLLTDPYNILSQQGNLQSNRLVRFTSLDQIIELNEVLKAYIKEAIDIEEKGKKVEFKKNPEPLPQELQHAFDDDPEFQAAFYALTPGRQRGYIISFSQPKQAQTRQARINKYRQQIINGLGLLDSIEKAD